MKNLLHFLETVCIASAFQSIMTVTPIRVVTMSSPSVTEIDSPPQMKTITSRISNFSVASLLADTGSIKSTPSSPPPPPSSLPFLLSSHDKRIFAAHHIMSSKFSPNSNNNNIDHQVCASPKNYSISQTSPCSQTVQNNENNDSSNSIKQIDNDLLEQRSQTQTPHSSIGSDEYDDSIHGDDDDDEDVDIEDMNSENSTNDKKPQPNHPSLGHASLMGGSVPLRPTPFSALAAAAAAWGGMSNNGVPGWPGRQVPPFGPHGLAFPGHFPGQLNGGEFHILRNENRG